MKHKNLLKAVCFLLLFAVFLAAFMQPCFKNDDEFAFEAFRFLNANPGAVDAIFIGTSNTYAFWNPAFAWKAAGVASMNMCSPALPFGAARYYVEEARKTQPGALFVICLNKLKTPYVRESNIHFAADYMPHSSVRTRMIESLCKDAKITSPLDKLEYLFPFIRFHTQWTDPLYPRDRNVLTSDTEIQFLRKAEDQTGVNEPTEDRAPLADFAEAQLRDLLDYLQESGARAVFTVHPQNHRAEYNALLNTAADTARAAGFDVLDLRECDLTDPAADYYNGNHTNIHGSLKFSVYLANVLRERYGLADRRTDAAYAGWDAAADNYLTLTASRLSEEEMAVLKGGNAP